MSWIKGFFKIAVISLVSIILMDMVSLLFKEKLSGILPGYGTKIASLHRGYPVNHFKPDGLIGFDINPNFKTTTFTKPKEYKKYEVWGNSYGCFDDEWPETSLNSGIYLAGDSFTWGYASYDKKFGTLLENNLKRKVFACGVTHTGQAHQFLKFKRLYDSGLRPTIVIVNLFSNDLDNDFFFPHTEIIDGYMVENVETCGDGVLSGNFKFNRFKTAELEVYVKEKIEENGTRSFLREYSLTANVIVGLKRSIQALIIETPQSSPCNRTVYAGLSNIGKLYKESRYTKTNREIIKKWIYHSNQNKYSLIFSFIPSKKRESDKTYPYIKSYIKSLGSQYFDFGIFCSPECRADNNIYYNNNSHFNEAGNRLYAKYLFEVINNVDDE